MRALFYRGHGAAAWAVRTWTWGPYAHVELQFTSGECWGATATHGTAWSNAPWAPAPESSLALPLSGFDEGVLRGWCHQETGCRYDWQGIFMAQVLGLRRSHPDRWFCSEAVVAGLQMVGYLPSRPLACTVDPSEAHRMIRRRALCGRETK